MKRSSWCGWYPAKINMLNDPLGRREKEKQQLHFPPSLLLRTELGRSPVSKYQIQPEYGDEQADAGRDG